MSELFSNLIVSSLEFKILILMVELEIEAKNFPAHDLSVKNSNKTLTEQKAGENR